MMRSLMALGCTGLALLAMRPMAARADDAVVARWIQFGPNATDAARPAPVILARAITTDAACPALAIDGVPASLSPRSAPDAPTDAFPMPVGIFPVTQCEAVVPAGHVTATIGGVDLKLPVANPKRILVIADTGCRMNGAAQQNCQDPVAFPLHFLATYETLYKPDLIVHVGDYFYRDTTCPAGSTPATCPNTQTQWGDNWASWNGDFFTPAKALLAAAPWIMTRGNHESCGRGAHGWYKLLDPKPYSAAAFACPKTGTAAAATYDFSPTYVVPAGAVNFLVHDSSYANDTASDAATAAIYKADLDHVLSVLGSNAGPSIFMTHKPTYGLVQNNPTAAGDYTEQALWNGLFTGGVPSSIALFLSGHIHQAEYVNFNDYTRYAPQLVIGVGGSLLDPPVTATSTRYNLPANSSLTVQTGGGTTVTAPVTGAHAQAEFGFAVMDATPTGFVATVYTINAQRAGRCVITLSPRNLACSF